MPSIPQPVRERGFSDFSTLPAEQRGGNRHWLMRAQNFLVEWVELAGGDAPFEFASEQETLLLGVRGSVRVQPQAAALAAANVPADAIGIVPAGRHAVRSSAPATCVLIASQRGDLAGRRVLNAQSYEPPDPRIVPGGTPFRRTRASDAIEVLAIEQIKASAERPRLKMLQTATLGINIVDYRGPRDRKALSPHAHADFEQASLAVHGDFVHHLRVNWASDADRWREDEHLRAPSPSMVVVPVEMIHTTEGVGEGRHLLLDIFCPPRFDFIDSGWVFNAGSYERSAPDKAAA